MDYEGSLDLAVRFLPTNSRAKKDRMRRDDSYPKTTKDDELVVPVCARPQACGGERSRWQAVSDKGKEKDQNQGFSEDKGLPSWKDFTDWEAQFDGDCGLQFLWEGQKRSANQWSFEEATTKHSYNSDATKSAISDECTGGESSRLQESMEGVLNLNLNYQDVMEEWTQRAPFWAGGHSSQDKSSHYMGEVPVLEEERRRREASVLRYKEKRQSRLFAKKIRYEVRKLNADKRPRLKGRFVKRASEEEGS